jgi:hypothetical protein
LLPGLELPLHLALTLSSLLDVAAACLVGLTILRLTGSTVAGLFGLCFYLFLPQNVFSAVNGVESALTAFLLSALLLVLVWSWRKDRADWVMLAIGTGVLGGLTILARLDAALVVGSVFVLVVLLQQRYRWRKAGAMAGVAVLIVMPWFVWSWASIGTPVPVSGESAAWLEREHFRAANPGTTEWGEIEHGLSNTKRVFLTQLPGTYFPDKAFAATLLFCGAALTAHFLGFARGTLRSETGRQLAIATPPFLAFFVALLINSGYRWVVREWYVAWGMPCIVLFAGVYFAYAARLLQDVQVEPVQDVARAWAPLALFGALTMFLAVAYVSEAREAWRAGPYFFQRVNLDAALFLKANTEENARVASFNAGTVGYFSDRPVVNLDGVVNPDAFEALQQHRLVEYLREANVQYVADRQGAWTFLPLYVRPDDWSASPWGEDPNQAMMNVAEIGRGNIATQYRIWKVE